jgi:metallo-beta-lactamase family protein
MLGPKIIIAGSGMMNGGRILHHALRYLSDEKNTLLLIGYQSHGTLGRALADGAKTVEVLGEHVRVGCHIKMVGSLSAHADQKKLVSWITDAGPRRVILNHGDASASQALAYKLGEHGVTAEPAKLATTFTV